MADAQRAAYAALEPRLRLLIEDAIEPLILLLDELDGDADIEADADFEPGTDECQP